MKRPELVTDEIYHIVLRGTGDSLIFKDESDYFRMIFSLFEFNTTKPIEIREQRKLRKFKGAEDYPPTFLKLLENKVFW